MCVCIKKLYTQLGTPHWGFAGPMQTNSDKCSNKHNLVKNFNWREADQLAIFKRSREVELGLPRTTSASDQNGI